jgi:hypothetical protein
MVHHGTGIPEARHRPQLILEAVDFCCRAGHGRLDRACSLYESAGFRLAEEHEIRQRGNGIRAQLFLPGLNV